MSVLENFRSDVRKFVLGNGYVKGHPNLTLLAEGDDDVDVCKSTISLWLHEMGFSYQ